MCAVPIYQVDAFASEPFAGNPAAVCLLEHDADAAWMQRVAAEMNLSETAFLRPLGDDRFGLRWFTPTTEVPLCGHATLASAHVVLRDAPAGAFRTVGREARFETLSGVLTCSLGDDGWLGMDLPANPVRTRMVPAPMEDALGARPLCVSEGTGAVVVEVGSREELLRLRPNFGLIASSPWGGLFIATCEGDHAPFDFHSRVFAPALGIDEDPVTGAAHCALATYWAKRLGRTDFVARQDSARGGELRVGLRGDRVLLAGQAVTVLRGTMGA